LKAEKGVKEFRLALVDSTRKILEKCLELIGVEVPERM
jgi:arginyl-tRNA synthetase